MPSPRHPFFYSNVSSLVYFASTILWSKIIISAESENLEPSNPSRDRVLTSNYCPPGFNGRTATEGCQGYVDCTNGAPTTTYECASGTLFDVDSGICNWPAMVTCNAQQYDQATTTTTSTVANQQLKFNCPKGYTGFSPTAGCLGYVACEDGEAGLSSKCPPGYLFDILTMACQDKDLVECEYVAPLSNNNGQLEVFCPIGYSGRAPSGECLGYVDCSNGKVVDFSNCPAGTKFDAMTRSCSFSKDFVCEAISRPTPAPNGAVLGDVEEENIIVVPSGCQPGKTGNFPLDGCKSYAYCVNGAEQTRYDCYEGTLFDTNSGLCLWASNVQCATSSPTRSPTPAPITPTNSPTVPPTALDMDGVLYYPDFSQGVCLNDGQQPPTVGKDYLFNNAVACCSAFFPNNMVNCRAASISAAPTTSPHGSVSEPEFYPDYANNMCKSDGKHSAFEQNFFFTYESCCKFEWLNETECLNNKDTAMRNTVADPGNGNLYYPDYLNNACKNDGEISPYETNTFESFEECCEFPFLDKAKCLANKPSTTPQNDFTGNYYYPNYEDNVCLNDGRQSEFEVNLFRNEEECCLFAWIDYDICKAGPVKNEWYPDYQLSICKRDGAQPSGITLTTSYSDCCSRFFPGDVDGCKDLSHEYDSTTRAPTQAPVGEGRWYPDFEASQCRNDGNNPDGLLLTTSYQLCCSRFMPANRHECFARSNGETLPPTQAPVTSDAWYPDVSTSRCVKNPSFQVSTDAYDSYESCCNYQWIVYKDDCLEDAKEKEGILSGQFYPDYFNSVCLNDGKHSPLAPLHSSIESCCSDKYINYEMCVQQSSNSAIPGGGTDHPYYPDYFDVVCRNDGQQSSAEKEKLFDSASECCNSDPNFINPETCMSNSVSQSSR